MYLVLVYGIAEHPMMLDYNSSVNYLDIDAGDDWPELLFR